MQVANDNSNTLTAPEMIQEDAKMQQRNEKIEDARPLPEKQQVNTSFSSTATPTPENEEPVSAARIPSSSPPLATAPSADSGCDLAQCQTSMCKENNPMYISVLPDELLIRIFSYLTGPDLCKGVALVCNQWHALSLDDYLWYELVKREVKRELLEIERKKNEELRKQRQREAEARRAAAEDKAANDVSDTAADSSSTTPASVVPVKIAVSPLNQSGPVPSTLELQSSGGVAAVVAEGLASEERVTATSSPEISLLRRHTPAVTSSSPLARQSPSFPQKEAGPPPVLSEEELQKRREAARVQKEQFSKAKQLKLIRPKSRNWRWVYQSKTRNLEKPHKDKFTGVGKYVWSGGAYYEGEWKDGLPDGIGIKFWDGTEYYEGSWVAGKMHGEGVYHWPDGATFTGGWKDGYHDGEGTYVWADGNKYHGGWKEGHRDGWGVRTWTDGDLFEGEWVEGKRTGRGTYSWPNGSKYVGEWENGSHHGQGTYTWLDGRKYVGSWENSKKHGKGTYYWPDGCMFIGEWSHGHRHGPGKMVWADGSMFQGMFVNDQREPTRGEWWDANGQKRTKDWAHPKPYDNYFADAEAVWEKKYRPEISARRLAALEKLKREAPELPVPIRESKVLDPEG